MIAKIATISAKNSLSDHCVYQSLYDPHDLCDVIAVIAGEWFSHFLYYFTIAELSFQQWKQSQRSYEIRLEGSGLQFV